MNRPLVALAAVIVVLASACSSSKTYSAHETTGAFKRHGYTLVEFEFPSGSHGRRGSVFVPRGGLPFSVFVGTDADAEQAWPDYEAQQDADRFDARRANVVVISDGGLTAAHRQRIRAALAALPDRGAPVVIAGTGDP